MRRVVLGMVFVLIATALILVSCGSDDEQGAEAAGRQEQTAAGDGTAGQAGEAAADNGDEGASVADGGTDSEAEEEDGTDVPFKSATHEGHELRWRVIGENLEVSISYATTGWVAVGFNPTRMMRDANIIIGYVADGEAVITDQFGNSTITHRPDEDLGGTYDLTNTAGTEEDGVTTLSFVMPLDSGDEYDRPLEQGETYTVIVAHGADGVDDVATYHQGRGSMEITL